MPETAGMALGAAARSSEGLIPGLVIAHFGPGIAVEAEDGQVVLCSAKRHLGGVAVGDRVLWEPADGGRGRILRVLPRRSLLTRPGHAGRLRLVAANLDRVVVVVAAEPEPDWLLVDQYLAACEHRGLDAALLVNKIDLPHHRERIDAVCAEYARLGYRSFGVSTVTGAGLDEVAALLAGHCSMLAGQSGVGKSSLTNRLLPDRQLRTNSLSERAGLGRHTTTTAMLFHLPGGGDLIDSPGVAVFGLAEMSPADLAAGYREFRPLLGRCRFGDCGHGADLGCAIREAVAEGRIAEGRYQRYRKLVDRLLRAQQPNG